MIRLVRTMKAGIREFLLLEQAERRQSSLTSTQRESSRTYYDAGVRRLRAAQQLRLQSELSAALLLYHQGALCLTLAYLISKEPNFEPDANDAAAAFGELDSALAADKQPTPPSYAHVKPFLVAPSDPLEFDRLALDDGQRLADELEVTAEWLARLLNPMTRGEIKVKRVLRVSVAAAVSLALLTSGAIWAFSPPDIAFHKRATSSSQAFDTAPEGAVDGRRYGQLGFHSNTEDSPWLSIDLGQSYVISRVKVYGRGDCCFDQSIPLALEASDDGVTFAKVSERTETFSQYDPWVEKPKSLVARFIRLRTLRHSVLVMSEVEVYGKLAK
jgi:hypothetical protein